MQKESDRETKRQSDKVGGGYRFTRTLPLLLAFAAVGLAQEVIDSVDVGGGWVARLVFNSDQDVVYGRSQGGDVLFALDCDSSRLVASIPVPAPKGLSYDSIDNKIYCSFPSPDDDSILVVDGRTHSRLRTLPLYWAFELAWDPVGNRLYVTEGDDDKVAVIDCHRDSVVGHIRVGRTPNGMELSPARRRLYVRNWDGETVSIVDMDSNQVVGTIRVDGTPQAGCFSEVAGKYYCCTSSELVVIDGRGDTVLSRFDMATPLAAAVAVDRHGLVMLAATHGTPGPDTVLVLDVDTDSIVGALQVGDTPCRFAWSQGTDLVYVANQFSDDVSVLAGEGTRHYCTFPVSDNPAVLLSVPQHRRIYVGHNNSHFVYVIRDSVTGISEQPSGKSPARLVSARPNPFSRGVVIGTGEVGGDEVRVDVRSSDGRLSRTLSSRVAGSRSVMWDGRDSNGKEVPAGVYVISLRRDPSTSIKVVKAD